MKRLVRRGVLHGTCLALCTRSDRGQTGRYGMMHGMAKRGASLPRNWWTLAGIVTLALAVVLVGVGAAVSATRETPQSESAYIPPPPVEAAKFTLSASDTIARLDDPARPFTMAIIGDSTGADRVGWAVLFAETLSRKFDRPVVFHQWGVTANPNGYLPVWSVGGGRNAPIEIWNASASGKNISYSQANLDAMLPVPWEQIDFLAFNHGHNQAPDTLGTAAYRFLTGLADRMPNAGLLVMLQNPEPETANRGTTQSDNVARLRDVAEAQGWETTDAYTLFTDRPGWESMIDDTGVHPTPDGYRLWADAVAGQLGV